MKKNMLKVIFLTLFANLIMNCGGDEKPVTERVLDHEENLKAVSDSISKMTQEIDSLLVK